MSGDLEFSHFEESATGAAVVEAQYDLIFWERHSDAVFIARYVVIDGRDDALDVVLGGGFSEYFEDASFLSEIECFEDAVVVHAVVERFVGVHAEDGEVEECADEFFVAGSF